MEWKHLTQIPDANGKSFAYPDAEWKELKIYSLVNNGTLCTLECTITNAIVVDEVQYIASTAYASPQSYDTVILLFSSKGVSVHNMLKNGEKVSGGVNVFYK